jgi:AcrR family transcriptional regulator
MPRAGLTTEAVIERAAQLLDDQSGENQSGDGLNIAALADSLGVRPPSLYKHIDGIQGLRRGIMLKAKANLAHALGQAAIGRSREDAITSMSFAYRGWALQHPAQYSMTTHAPVSGDDEDAEVSSAIANVVYNILAGYRLEGDDAIDATRFLRSALHGFVDLETSRAFELPVDLERSFVKLVESITNSLAAWKRP